MAPGTIIIVSSPRELTGEYVTLPCDVTATGANFAEPTKRPKFKGWAPKDDRRFPKAPKVLR
jgi:hypothetical protein